MSQVIFLCGFLWEKNIYQDWNFILAPEARFVYKRLLSDAPGIGIML